MANRKGVFIGAYVPHDLKESLRRKAASEHRTLSQEILGWTEAVPGRGLLPQYRSPLGYRHPATHQFILIAPPNETR